MREYWRCRIPDQRRQLIALTLLEMEWMGKKKQAEDKQTNKHAHFAQIRIHIELLTPMSRAPHVRTVPNVVSVVWRCFDFSTSAQRDIVHCTITHQQWIQESRNFFFVWLATATTKYSREREREKTEETRPALNVQAKHMVYAACQFLSCACERFLQFQNCRTVCE